MAQPIEITQCVCPDCRGTLVPANPAGGDTTCPICRWNGKVYLFRRFPIDVTAAESALSEDATCMHHPSKKATAICAGTGDFICSLCAIEVNGQTYSAEYLNKAGRAKIGNAFDRYLPRPDSHAYLLVITVLIPYVNFVMIPTACFWIPYAFNLYAKALRLRHENALFAKVMPKSRVVTIPIYLSLIGLGWILGVVSLLFVYLRRRA